MSEYGVFVEMNPVTVVLAMNLLLSFIVPLTWSERGKELEGGGLVSEAKTNPHVRLNDTVPISQMGLYLGDGFHLSKTEPQRRELMQSIIIEVQDDVYLCNEILETTANLY